jgi:hypothetical protein
MYVRMKAMAAAAAAEAACVREKMAIKNKNEVQF